MRIRLESVKKIGRKIGINDDKGYVAAVFLALIVVSAVVIGYFAFLAFNAKPEGYNTIYLLDTNKKAVDYPEVLVANQNSTFNVYVGVINHQSQSADYEVRVKIAKILSTYPLEAEASQVYPINALEPGKTSETLVTVTQNEGGTHYVVFELWQSNGGIFEFTQNYCVLSIQVIS